MLLGVLHTSLLAVILSSASLLQQSTGTLIVRVVGESGPVEHATVRIGATAAETNAAGEVELTAAAGQVEIVIERFGYGSKRVAATVKSGAQSRVVVELEQEAVVNENVVVTATRTTQRVQDLPLRVEVIPQEEIDEKLSMTPGDVAMMLTETNGLRVQVTSPATGAANVRVQGLRGRYTQIFSDGLPLYGQAGSLNVLQIPPMDLAQVEVIKGVASALYGSAALGGVINLVSRRPKADQREREVLFNRTSEGGTDGALWLSDKLGPKWGYTFLGGAHFQQVQDVNDDGWSDVPSYQRALARPRIFWEDGTGRSVFMTVGAMFEDRDGGTIEGARAPDGSPFPQTLTTAAIDAGVVGRFPMGPSRVLTFRSSGLVTSHDQRFGESRERDRHHTWFGETALTGAASRHTWVIGGAFQQDGYSSQEFPAFDYGYVVPSLFVQDDYAPLTWLSASASGRVDFHNEFGTFFSPRVSLLVRPAPRWSARLSAGTGFYPPTPFLDEIDDVGLSRLTPLGDLEAERGRSASFDVSWRHESLELTGTLFRSRIDHALQVREDADAAGKPLSIVNAAGPGNTSGTELIAPPAPRPARSDPHAHVSAGHRAGSRDRRPAGPAVESPAQRGDRSALGDRGPGAYRRGSLLHGTAAAGRLAIPDRLAALLVVRADWRVSGRTRTDLRECRKPGRVQADQPCADRPARASHRRSLARRRMGPVDRGCRQCRRAPAVLSGRVP